MTSLIRLFLSIAPMLLSASCYEVKAPGSLKAEIEVFRAFPVFDSEGSRRVARSELRCDPCEEVVDEERDGNRYFLNPDAGIQLTSDVIESLGVDTAEQGAVVFVVLSAQGKSMIESLIVEQDDFAANVVSGKVIGIVPLRLFDSRFVIALAPTRSAAEEIAERVR